MAVLTITPVSLPVKYPVTPITANALDEVFTPAGADFADGARFKLTGKEILIVHNDNAGAQTITITSQVDPYNRLGTITDYSIGIGEYAVFPQFPMEGWADASGYLNMVASATDVEFLVLRLVD